jgi:two-component system chemotaxis response regulator CheY
VIGKTIELTDIEVNQIYYAKNGKEALDIMSENWIDIVFADINMPVMSGIEMIENMSDHGLMDSIPVVIVSTEGSSTRIDELKAKGIRGYIRKPFTPEKIGEIFHEILGGSK